MQCNGDMRHVIEIVGILSATVIYYRELKFPRVTAIRNGKPSLDLINTPLGWALLITISCIVSLPAYVYFSRKVKGNPFPYEVPQLLQSGSRYRPFKTILVFLLCFYVTYKQ